MMASEFDSILEKRILKMKEMLISTMDRRCEEMRRVLATKAKEYAPNVDRLDNFKIGEEVVQRSMAEYCWGLMAKHIASLPAMVADPDAFSNATWEEKFGDSHNYFVLLEACIQETRAMPKPQKRSVFVKVIGSSTLEHVHGYATRHSTLAGAVLHGSFVWAFEPQPLGAQLHVIDDEAKEEWLARLTATDGVEYSFSSTLMPRKVSS